jgi:cytochrome c-type biogenesis protein CcmH
MIALLLAATFAAAPGPASGADENPLPPEQEARVQRLAKELRCPVCQGLSIADSPAAMARSQLGVVRELVAQGKTDRQIEQYFVARYGEWVLLEPPARGVAWLAWTLPILFVLGGAGLVVWLATRGSRRPSAEGAASNVKEDGDPYLAAVRRDVDS